jgi:predicted O-linked N-acetylglucosamine transferase (SPINDLY family)
MTSIDIALDTFPYNGDTTTFDALWMGVPLVTLSGEAFVSRRGVSHLNAVGLRDLVASSSEEYVRIAVDLARRPEQLQLLRTSLRERMRASALCDWPRYTRHFEAAIRQIWSESCRSSRHIH